jgi:hypothetical protein
MRMPNAMTVVVMSAWMLVALVDSTSNEVANRGGEASPVELILLTLLLAAVIS